MRSLSIFLLASCLSAVVHGQDDVAREISRQLEESRTKFPGMRPHIFFSQDKYAPGDTAFFRVFILTEDERILAERFLLTLELVSPGGTVVAKQNVSCVTFGAASQLMLPKELIPGHYEIRLYSDRMSKTYGLSTTITIVGEKEMKSTPAATSLSIFPEGGHIIAEALNRLVIRASGKVPESAALYSGEERIMTVNFEKDGLATLLFIPLSNKSYRIEFVSAGELQSVPVQAAEPDALTMRVYGGPRKMWVLDIPSGPKGPKTGNLVLVSHRTVIHAQEIRISGEGRGSLLVAPDFFPDGFSELFIVDQQQKVLSYRPVYRQSNGTTSATITGLPENAKLRELVSASIRLTDSTQSPVLGALSVSVVSDGARVRPLRTPDPSVALYHDQLEVDIEQSADRVELELMARPMPLHVVPEYQPLVYNSNLNLSGRVYSTDPATPLPYACKIVIYLHKDLIRYEAPVEGDGNFHFPKIYDFLGEDHVFYKVVQQNNKDLPRVRVEWSSQSSMGRINNIQFAPTDQTDTYGDLRKRKHVIDQSYNFFLSSPAEGTEEINLNGALEDEFQEADVTIYPREYTPFETMQELILEVVPSLLFRARQKDSLVEVTLTTRSPFVAQRYAEGNALYIIDGWMTTDTRYLMSLSPKEVVAVKVINDIGKLDRLGILARNGVLFIQTSIPEVTRRDLASRLYVMDGFSPTLSFSERYPVQKRVPDLRSLLYWNPQISTDSTGTANFTFRTSDVPGTYWLRVVGATSTGHMFTIEKPFEVKFR